MKTYVYIGAGGFVGAVIRYLVKGMQLSGYDGVMPLQTLAVNTLGAFVLAFLLTIALEIKEFNYKLLPGLSVGLLGALTTFSTLCKEAVSLTMSGYVFDAVAYILFSVLAGFVCAWGGRFSRGGSAGHGKIVLAAKARACLIRKAMWTDDRSCWNRRPFWRCHTV